MRAISCVAEQLLCEKRRWVTVLIALVKLEYRRIYFILEGVIQHTFC
jgi:hypothetical protein